MKKSDKNIILIGFMGSGKTTLGKKLALRLKREFYDMDRYIEKKENKTISQLFEEKGEAYFREAESLAAKDLGGFSGIVIATGGGVIKNAQNMQYLSRNGIIVYLNVTPEHIYRNIGNDKNRPLLQGGDKMEKIKTLMAERQPTYEKYAQVTVEVAGGAIGQITDRIIKALEGKL